MISACHTASSLLTALRSKTSALLISPVCTAFPDDAVLLFCGVFAVPFPDSEDLDLDLDFLSLFGECFREDERFRDCERFLGDCFLDGDRFLEDERFRDDERFFEEERFLDNERFFETDRFREFGLDCPSFAEAFLDFERSFLLTAVPSFDFDRGRRSL